MPDGFATTADAYRQFVGQEGLAQRITGLMRGLDSDAVQALVLVGDQVRRAMVEQPLPPSVEEDIR